jgi:hypothetical protein
LGDYTPLSPIVEVGEFKITDILIKMVSTRAKRLTAETPLWAIDGLLAHA